MKGGLQTSEAPFTGREQGIGLSKAAPAQTHDEELQQKGWDVRASVDLTRAAQREEAQGQERKYKGCPTEPTNGIERGGAFGPRLQAPRIGTGGHRNLGL